MNLDKYILVMRLRVFICFIKSIIWNNCNNHLLILHFISTALGKLFIRIKLKRNFKEKYILKFNLLSSFCASPFYSIFALFHLQIMILQEVNGRVASNRSISWERNHLLMSNLEPRQSYYIKIAAFNSKGIGPFSKVLHVR